MPVEKGPQKRGAEQEVRDTASDVWARWQTHEELKVEGRRADLVTACTTRMKPEACMSSVQHQATLFFERPRERSTTRRRSYTVGNCTESCCDVYLVTRDGTDIVSIDDFVAKTRCKKYLNAVLNAMEVLARTRQGLCRRVSARAPRLALRGHHRLHPPHRGRVARGIGSPTFVAEVPH